MAEWATLGEVGRRRRGTVDAKTQEKLVMELLGVYMRDGWVYMVSTIRSRFTSYTDVEARLTKQGIDGEADCCVAECPKRALGCLGGASLS